MESNCISLMLLLTVLGALVSGLETASGIPGIPGSHGVPGMSGKDGRDGPKGAKGDPGPSVSAGGLEESGDKGDPGIKGPIGKRGRRGPSGNKGDPGIMGVIGEKGKSGDYKSTLKSAFSAKRKVYTYPPRDSPIKFTDILSNDQNHYDSSTGKFTCHISGYYYFVYHATSNNNLCVNMNKNGETITSFCSHGDFVQVSSGGLVLHLQVSDKVWLEATVYNALMGQRNHDSVFSGFLLFPD
ncbi:complement C1q subcomponent subunit C-like [Leucoraja erinacea]|uniref:complement C1q subcomponent subunit C-like n=1 Tax=Leucoraja erinaceus TaxID=7782 RepID=UPI0024549134|nr:complement C1q subcomponent subunit C-like [Leucoraja erinacea]